MKGNARSTVTENLYIFTAHVPRFPHPDHIITVVFLPHKNTPAEIVRPALIDYLDRDPTGQEVWVVSHLPHRAQLARILRDSELNIRRDGRPMRGFVVSSDGAWSPHTSVPRARWIEADSSTVEAVIAAGLRRQFCDAKALLTAHGRFHFGKPGGTHAKNFLRAQPAVARDAHAHFTAAALLGFLKVEHVRRVWIDTAGITSVAGALGAARAAHFPKAPQLLVDTFGGYDGFASVAPSMGAADAVIISSSTSGSLARRVRQETSVPEQQIATLYFVAGLENEADEAGPAPIGTVCDLTRRSPHRDDSYIDAFVTHKAGHCLLCADNEPAVPLEGDGFLPVTGTLTARTILATDGSRQPLSAFVELAMPYGALRVRHARHGHRMRVVGTAVAPLLAAPAPAFVARMGELLADLARHSPRRPRIDQILYLPGDDSRALAMHLHQRLPDSQHPPTSVDEGIPALERAGGKLPRHILVVCAVASSGRSLLDVSRRLRFLPETTALSYLVAVAHPESEFAWNLAKSSLSKRSAAADNGFAEGWRVYRESLQAAPNERAMKVAEDSRSSDTRWSSSDPWEKEAALIEELIIQPHGDPDYGALLAARAEALSQMPYQESSKRLFLGSGIGVAANGLPGLNRGFVFWDFEWQGDQASEELVYWTITSVLQHNRWSSATTKAGQYLHVSTGGHFFVIEPMMFDRFNDPVIQASILRASSSGELDYTTDGARSRFMRDLIVDAARNAATERGAAINEFLLSLAMGTLARDGRHLRLKPAELEGLLSDLGEIRLGKLSRELVRLVALGPERETAQPIEDLDEPF